MNPSASATLAAVEERPAHWSISPRNRATSMHPVIQTGVVAYVLFVSLYYLANFCFRWSEYLIFSGHGVYGWPAPTRLHQIAVITASLAGPLLVCCATGAFAWIALRQRALFLAVGISILLICFAELDATWYSMSQEHIRLVDFELFVGLNVKAHLGVDASDLPRLVFRCVGHVLVLALTGAAIYRLQSSASRWLRPPALRIFVLAGLVILIVGNSAAYALSNDEAWQQISRSDRLNATISALVRKTDREAQLVQRMYDASRRSEHTKPLNAFVPPSPEHGVARDASVIVIALEGWNPDFVSDSVMPFVSNLRSVGQVFQHHYSSGNNTLLGTLGLLYGQSPTFFFDHEANGQRSVFLDTLRARSYRTKYFGEGLSSYRFIDSYLTNFTDGGVPLPPGDSLIAGITSFVREYPRTFTYYYYGNTHFPYHHDPRFRRFQPEVSDDYQFDPDDIRRSRKQIVNRYRNTLAEADAFIARLLGELPWQRMIVVVTGDHGESMLENGRLSHSSSLERVQTSTPFVIYLPGQPPSTRTDVTSHLDVFPTIFDVLGLAPARAAQGQSMFGGGTRGALVMHNDQNRRPVDAAMVSGDSKILLNLEKLREPRITGLLDGTDHPATATEHQIEIQAAVDQLRRLLGMNGCRLADSLEHHPAIPGKASQLDAVVKNLRFCGTA